MNQDSRECDMAPVTDFKEIRVIDNNDDSKVITKEQLVKVLEELIGSANPTKTGLLHSQDYLCKFQTFTFSNNNVIKIARLDANYTGFCCLGYNSPSGDVINLSITRGTENIYMKGQGVSGLIFYKDSQNYIYAKCQSGRDVTLIFISSSSKKVMLNIDYIQLPPDAVIIEESI